jgi:hypothetical protein
MKIILQLVNSTVQNCPIVNSVDKNRKTEPDYSTKLRLDYPVST